MTTDSESLIPTPVAFEFIAAAEQESVAMRLSNVQTMPTSIENVPTVTAPARDAIIADEKFTARCSAHDVQEGSASAPTAILLS